MPRSTIDFGIDLGTTNSAIAVASRTGPHVIKNNEGIECTPSAVWIDANKRLFVGQLAKERLLSDPDDAFAEFKLEMGQEKARHFRKSGLAMTPVELSAEVLKSLKSDARQALNEDITSAVITIPAAFEANQRDATQRAAHLAGMTGVTLLQEPVAAALMYGFDRDTDHAFWMVYDIGGGTFDAAIIQVQDGGIVVVNHSGDNNLGGKLLDWAIVEELFVPALARQARLSDFRRGNEKWRSAFAKLKQDAERAKIRLSREQVVTVVRDFLCTDDAGKPVAFQYDFHRADLERLAEPYIVRTINTCRRALKEKSLRPTDIQRVILVGGPTLMPYLRDRLLDPRAGLGIPLESNFDPLTVVAQGAALFAAGQPLPRSADQLKAPRARGSFTISFPLWTFRGSDTEPQVAAKVEAPDGRSLQGYSVEFANNDSRPPWQSGKLPVDAQGGILTTLFATGGAPNTFRVTLRDPFGAPQQLVTSPEVLTYTVGLVLDHTVLTHSVGVALATNEVEWFLEKGAALPARMRQTLHTAYEVNPGVAGSVIRIPVVEGESRRADRNTPIGKIEVMASDVSRRVPVDSDIEITVSADQAGLIHMSAFIPLLDEEYEEVLHMGDTDAAPSCAHLQEELGKQRKRLDDLRAIAGPQVQRILRSIDEERIVHQVEVEIGAAQNDPASAQVAQKRLRTLAASLDQAEDTSLVPSAIATAENLISLTRNSMREYGSSMSRLQHDALREAEDSLREAIPQHDLDLLDQRTQALHRLILRLLDTADVLPGIIFTQLARAQQEMTDQARAEDLIKQGKAARQAENVEELRTVNQKLHALLPVPLPPPDVSILTR